MENSARKTQTSNNEILSRVQVTHLKEFTNLIRDSGTILWVMEFSKDGPGITAILPGVWTGKEVVPHVEITGILPGDYPSDHFRKIFNGYFTSHLDQVPEDSIILIYEDRATYIHEGLEYPFMDFVSLMEEDPEKRYLRNGNIRIGIPEPYWKWRKVIVRSLQTQNKRSREAMGEEPTKPAAVPAQSASGKAVSQEEPEEEQTVKPAPEPKKPDGSETPDEEKSEEETGPRAMAAPFKGNKNKSKSEKDTSNLASDDCIACSGTGTSSSGNKCKPCKGSGKKPAETEDKGESNDQKSQEENSGADKQQENQKEDEEESQGTEKDAESSAESSQPGPETQGNEEAASGENGNESGSSQQTSQNTSGKKKVKAGTKSGQKKRRSPEEIKQDKIKEVQDMGFNVLEDKKPEDMELSELLSCLENRGNEIVSFVHAVQKLTTESTQPKVPEDREEKKNLIEEVLPEDVGERAKMLGELLAK